VSGGELVALVCCDLGSIVRGRSLFSAELEGQLESGVSWVPANHALTPLGGLAEPNPFGSIGDLRLVPDPGTRVRVDSETGGEALELLLCDITETDGASWECCPRSFLRDALVDVQEELGGRVMASFEHEFQLLLDSPTALPFSLEAQREAEPFATRVMNALLQAGVEPERFFPEYAPHQFEIPLAPAEGLTSADRSVVFREVVREVARAQEMRASFTPLLDPSEAGNGVHIHISLLDLGGQPLFYDATRPGCLSELAASFAAGILRHARALSALTAPSPISAARLSPHRWSAGAVCLARQGREGLLRIPPLVALGGGDPALQLRLEYRGADGSANPYLALGAILRAGLAGVREELRAPPILERDPGELEEDEAERYGLGGLPGSLEEALEALEEDVIARDWMGPLLYEAYVSIKQAEVGAAAELDLEENCRRYAAIY
jgi:glutamine synthetase